MARPHTKTGVSTSTQRELVWWIAKGLPKEQAAKRAGLPSSGRLYQFMRTKDYAKALKEALTDRMSTELAPKAVSILDEIMSDRDINPRIRVDAAKALLDRSGYSPSETRKVEEEEPPNSIVEMSIPELEAYVAGLQRDMAKMEGDADFVQEVEG